MRDPGPGHQKALPYIPSCRQYRSFSLLSDRPVLIMGSLRLSHLTGTAGQPIRRSKHVGLRDAEVLAYDLPTCSLQYGRHFRPTLGRTSPVRHFNWYHAFIPDIGHSNEGLVFNLIETLSRLLFSRVLNTLLYSPMFKSCDFCKLGLVTLINPTFA